MKIFDIVLFEEQIVLQVTEPLLEQLTGDELNGILEYYKEDFNIGGYTYQKDKDWRVRLIVLNKFTNETIQVILFIKALLFLTALV